jgi:methyl-accepting chemotaxis protein
MIQHLKIGSRLALGFCLILLLATAILLIGLWRMAELEASSEYVIDKKVAAMTTAMNMREAGSELALALRKVVTPPMPPRQGRGRAPGQDPAGLRAL